MDAVTELFRLDFPSLFLSVFIVIIGMKSIVSAFEWFFDKCGIEFKWMQKKREDHELLITTAQNLKALQCKRDEDVRQSIQHDDMIREDLEKLTTMFIDKSVDDIRWEIINFATKISEGKPCNKDSYKHCLHMYEKYETFIEENGLTNGEVELSMEIINESYKEKMKNGF